MWFCWRDKCGWDVLCVSCRNYRTWNVQGLLQLGNINISFDMIYDTKYLSTAIGLSPGGSSTVHIYTQTVHRTTQQFWESAGRAPSWRVIPWQLPYNWGKSTENPVRVAASKNTWGFNQYKIQITPSGIEPATFRLTGQHLNQLQHSAIFSLI